MRFAPVAIVTGTSDNMLNFHTKVLQKEPCVYRRPR